MQSYAAEANNENNQSETAFANIPNSVSHKRTRMGRKSYQCHNCRKTFVYQSFLMRHMEIHTGEKPYECEKCGKAFRYYLHLRKHFRNHFAEKSNECKECGKAFSKSSKLTEHIRVHTGEKPYKCKCGKAYTNSSGLKYHLKTHHWSPMHEWNVGKASLMFSKCWLWEGHVEKELSETMCIGRFFWIFVFYRNVKIHTFHIQRNPVKLRLWKAFDLHHL